MKNAHTCDNAFPGTAWSVTAVSELEAMCTGAGDEAKRDEALGRHTSMGVGGPTPLMLWPSHPETVGTLLRWCGERGLAWRVLGGGSNVLASDAGVTEPVINLTRLTDGTELEAPKALFPAGLPTAQALRASIRAGLAGLVWSTGLPGTIGGAAAGNAGCWGSQMADVVARLDIVDGSGKWQTVEADELDWSYRRLRLPDAIGSGAAIVAVAVDVHPEDPAKLDARSEELHRRKRKHQPIGARNAGCIFKNPDPEHAAGALIDHAGCKGMGVGDARISELHGNFLINRGDATCADVEALISRVKATVREQFGIALEEEIQLW